jgi:hypothetical protein
MTRYDAKTRVNLCRAHSTHSPINGNAQTLRRLTQVITKFSWLQITTKLNEALERQICTKRIAAHTTHTTLQS